MPLGKATIDYDGYELLVKYEPFRPDIVTEIKGSIPGGFREWDAKEKVWRIAKAYKPVIEEIFDVFEYALRDFTGDDRISQMRQGGFIREREKRRAKQQAEWDAATEKRRQQDADKEAKAEARRAKAKAAGGQVPPREARAEPSEEQAYDFMSYLERLKLQKKFLAVWPEAAADERWFTFWWSLYTVGGRDYANRKFSQMWAEKHAPKKATPRPAQPLVPNEVLLIMKSWHTCSLDAAKGTYRNLALKWHPDRNQGNPQAETIMKTINNRRDQIWSARGWL